MKKLLALLSLTLLTSCASAFGLPKVDEELKPYVEEFRMVIKGSPYESKMDYLTMKFSDLDDDTIGQCYNIFVNVTYSSIDMDYWRTATHESKMSTVFHELGHCVCNLGHTKIGEGLIDKFVDTIMAAFNMMPDQYLYVVDMCPDSYMYPREMSQRCLESHYQDYIQKMQKDCRAL